MATSMYVYNADAQFRFVIIAGKKYREGEQVEAKVTLSKIRSDGIECEFDGTRFFYPRQSL
jgi:Type II secretion system protein B